MSDQPYQKLTSQPDPSQALPFKSSDLNNLKDLAFWTPTLMVSIILISAFWNHILPLLQPNEEYRKSKKS